MSKRSLTLSLSWQSLWNRRFTTILTLLSITLSFTLLLMVERVRLGARSSFTNTISQTDLIVGARTGSVQLLLYTIFHMGSATANVSYETYQDIKDNPAVAWTIPISLGDSHRGYRVVGTSEEMFKHYHYRRNQGLKFASGQFKEELFTVTLGSEVAQKLGYDIGEQITLSHGVAATSFQHHDDKPFTVTGILARTSTPMDRSLFVTLNSIEAIHADWYDGAPPEVGNELSADALRQMQIAPEQITAFLIGATSRFETLSLQRTINEYNEEALLAIIPGVALSELWDGISYAENALRIVSLFVVFVGLLGMLIAIYNSLNERRREMAILRSLGAGPWLIARLLIFESFLLTCMGVLAAIVLTYVLLWLAQPIIERQFGLYLPIPLLQPVELVYAGVVLAVGILLGAIPAWRAYKNTLHDGLAIRI